MIAIERIDLANGENLAKVLWYYNLISNTSAQSQKIICPFHDDVNPSLKASFDDGKWFCFGCNRSGDAADFVKLMERKHNGLNDLQSYKAYARILRSDKCSEIKISAALGRSKARSRSLYNEAYDYYHGLAKTNWSGADAVEKEALSYMIARGFTAESLRMCNAKVNHNASYGLIFPMHDNGKFKGWVCRTMNKEVEAKRKYLYNEGFSRASTLVGDYGKQPYVIVVEGYMDRLKLLQFGEQNVVAILGWKMSQQQMDKLKAKGIVTIISALDNDDCGKRGTEYLKRFFDVERFAYMKGVKDPGDMDARSFKKMMDKTMQKYYKRTER